MRRKLILVFVVLISSIFFTSNMAYAEEDIKLEGNLSEEEIMKVHEDLDGILNIDHGLYIQDGARQFGYGTMKFFGWVLGFFEKGIDAIVSFGGHFYASDGVERIIDKLMPFIMGLFLLTLIVVGVLLMLNKIDKRENLILNVLLAVSMLVIIPNVFPMLDKLMNDGIEHVEDGDNLMDAITRQNIADLNMYVEKDFQYGGEGGLPQPKHPFKQDVGTEDMSGANRIEGLKFSPTETLDMYEGENSWWFNDAELEDFKKDKTEAYEILIHRTDFDGDGDETKLRKLRKNMIPGTEIARQSYYRYDVNWGTIIATLAVLVFASAITVVKMSRIIFDLGFHMIFSLFVAVTDITGGQRIKKMLTEIFSSFAVFFVMVLILRLFIMYANWLIGIKPEVGTVSYLLMLLGGAWALLDAPDIVQRLLGIDAGLRSGWQTMAGAYAGAKALGGLGKGISKGIGAVGKGATGALAFGKGLAGRPPRQNSGGGSESGGGRPSHEDSDSNSDIDEGMETGETKQGDSEGGLDSDYPRGEKSDSLLSANNKNGDRKNRKPKSNISFSTKGENGSNNIANDSSGKGGTKKSGEAISANNKKGSSLSTDGKQSSSGKNNPLSDMKFSTSGDGLDAPKGGDINKPERPMTDNAEQPMSSGPSSSSATSSGGSDSVGSSKASKPGQTPVSTSSSGGSVTGMNASTSGSSEYVSTSPDERNPFFQPTILGSSRRGQERASFKARAYNTGLKWRGMSSKAKNSSKLMKSSIKDVSDSMTSSSRPEKDIKIYNRRK